jgi:hypothetical protein
MVVPRGLLPPPLPLRVTYRWRPGKNFLTLRSGRVRSHAHLLVRGPVLRQRASCSQVGGAQIWYPCKDVLIDVKLDPEIGAVRRIVNIGQQETSDATSVASFERDTARERRARAVASPISPRD